MPTSLPIEIYLMDRILAMDDDPLAGDLKRLQLIVSEEVRDYAISFPQSTWSHFYDVEFRERETEPLDAKLYAGHLVDPDALNYRRLLRKIKLICPG